MPRMIDAWGTLPAIIQGGMGVGVSHWPLARAVALTGQLGVVSGTALDQLLVRRLQDGDPGGHVQRALAHFPDAALADRLLATWLVPGGKRPLTAYRTLPLATLPLSREAEALLVVANFVEVWLAREGHDGRVGINYLEKIQLPHLPSIYGALLAGVDCVLMGAGIPLKIPGVIDALARHEPASYPIAVTGAALDESWLATFSPRHIVPGPLPPLRRPPFLAIVSSATLAATLVKRASGHVDGFVVEGRTAGGHNAPPRGRVQYDAEGQPVYGPRDDMDMDAIRRLERPFWLAGGYGTRDGLARARASGAAGVQVGTAFAYCVESGLRREERGRVLRAVREGGLGVRTDPLASPTGFPFKVVPLSGTVADPAVYAQRPRICDLGYLREAYRRDDGTIGFRCAAEPVSVYVAKGGDARETVGRKCLCNALVASGGYPQIRAGRHVEPGIVTSGDALDDLRAFLPADGDAYTAADVVRAVLGG